jgi:hypothetical protein
MAPVPEVMFQIIPAVLQHVVVFVFYLPPRPAAFCQIRGIIAGYQFVRYPTVTVFRISGVFWIGLEIYIKKV